MIFNEKKVMVCEKTDCENIIGCEHEKTKEEIFVNVMCDVCKTTFEYDCCGNVYEDIIIDQYILKLNIKENDTKKKNE